MPYPGHDDDSRPGGTRGEGAHAPATGRRHAQALVQTLERQVIPAIARRHRPALAGITEADVALFVSDLLNHDEAALQARVAHLRQQGLGARVLCEDLLAAAARRLGTLWEDDRCDFVQVTLGVGQLHGLLRGLGPQLRGPSSAPVAAAGLRVLLAQLPQEQHVFGLSMLAHFFQAEGWAVSTASGSGAAGAPALAQAHFVDAVGFSIGSESLLEPLRREIAAVRLASRNPDVVILVGGPLLVLHPGWARELGADAGPARAHEVPAFVARLVNAARR